MNQIVPFSYASVAYQASLVEPWFLYRGGDQTSLICRQSVRERLRLGIYRTQIQQNPVIFLVVTGIKCQASYRVAREENNTSQQTTQKVMNEKKYYFEFYTASKVKICVKPFSAKLLSALFQSERSNTCRQTWRSWRAPTSSVLAGKF